MTDHVGVQALGERVAVLEAKALAQDNQLAAIARDVKAIMGTLDKISGGKTAVFGMFAIIGAVAAFAAAVLTVIVRIAKMHF